MFESKKESHYLAAATWISAKLNNVAHVDKSILFAVCGGILALLGSFIGQIINPYNRTDEAFLFNGLKTTYIACGLGIALSIVESWYLQRLEIAGKKIAKTAIISSMGGFVGGVCLILMQANRLLPEELTTIVGCMIESAIIIVVLAGIIPNLSRKNALYAGIGVGVMGGIFTLMTSKGFFDMMAVDSFKGFSIGLAIALAERVSRESWIVIHRDLSDQPMSSGIVLNDKPPTISLGEQMLQIGSSDKCEIYVVPKQGDPPVLGSIGLQDNRIVFQNFLEQDQQTLSDGEKLTIANLTIETFSKKRSRAQTNPDEGSAKV